MGFLTWLFFGLVVGLLARFLVPGREPGGCLMTVVIGIVGAAIGGWIGTQLGWGRIDGFDLRSMGLAILGSIVLLLVLRAIRGR